MLGIPLLGAIPEDTNVIISTNKGEPLVLNKKLTLSGIAFENAARRLIGKQDYFIDLDKPYKGVVQKFQEFFPWKRLVLIFVNFKKSLQKFLIMLKLI